MFKKIKRKCKNLLILGRYHNPVGSFLLMWPCYWGCLSQINNNIIDSLIYFTIGAFVMRGAGCTINDVFDKNFDKQVERTKNRPLASGLISTKESVYFIFFQLIIGLYIVLQFEFRVIVWSLLIVPLVICYPLLKRITYFPQIALGLAFNWGVILGHMSQSTSFNFEILYLYFGGVFLTIAYDTVYGFQDIKDDKKLGLKSMSIFFEKNIKFLLFTYIVSAVLFFIFLIVFFKNHYINLVFGSLILFAFLFQYFAFTNKVKLEIIFKSNIYIGAFVSFIIAVQNYL